MTISWFGLSSFKIVGRDITIITDPFGSQFGLAGVRGAADVVISTDPSNPCCNNFSSISSEPFLITGPGEYDIKGAFVIGTAASDGQSATIYSIELEEVRIAFIGPIKQASLSESQRETFEGTDIVLIGVGGKSILDFEQASKIATQLEPFFIIPHSFKVPHLNLDLDKLDKFVREMGGKSEELEKLTVKKKDLTSESTQLVILKPQR